ncbi:hypothetical protein FKM82_021943 [Ascaphus truei]
MCVCREREREICSYMDINVLTLLYFRLQIPLLAADFRHVTPSVLTIHPFFFFLPPSAFLSLTISWMTWTTKITRRTPQKGAGRAKPRAKGWAAPGRSWMRPLWMTEISRTPVTVSRTSLLITDFLH